mmetsp:Transcript_26368/g.87851  ORF Transcript_26368/g.87851 Transcript_26368/m.87851 type:complete len:280 (-) Transcript_26368:199-1038(-)
MVWPVMKAASGDARKHAAPTTSSTVPRRPSGVCCVAHRCMLGRSHMAALILVRIKPGAMPLTRTPEGPHSSARPRVSAWSPALLIAYATTCLSGECVTKESTLMIVPALPASQGARKSAPKAIEVSHPPRVLVSATLSYSARLICSTGMRAVTPAQFTSTSSEVAAVLTAAAAAKTDCSSRTSHSIPTIVVPGLCPCSRIALCSTSLRTRSRRYTVQQPCAAKADAIPNPIPPAPPVTTTVFPTTAGGRALRIPPAPAVTTVGFPTSVVLGCARAAASR